MRSLIVDSNAAGRAAQITSLLPVGSTIVAIESIREARQLLAADRFDLVLIEIELPDGYGFGLCAEARERLGNDAIIILISMANRPLLRVTGIQLGADDVLFKPWDSAELWARIDAQQRRRALADVVLSQPC